MAKEGKHTPGTWSVGHAGFERRPVVVASRPGRPVTVALFDSGKREEDEANARLTAAAKGILAALTKIVAFCDDPEGSEKSEGLALGLSRLLPEARAALAKATASAAPATE